LLPARHVLMALVGTFPLQKHLSVKPGEPQPSQSAESGCRISAHSHRTGEQTSPSRLVPTPAGTNTGLSSAPPEVTLPTGLFQNGTSRSSSPPHPDQHHPLGLPAGLSIWLARIQAQLQVHRFTSSRVQGNNLDTWMDFMWAPETNFYFNRYQTCSQTKQQFPTHSTLSFTCC